MDAKGVLLLVCSALESLILRIGIIASDDRCGKPIEFSF